MNRIGVCSWSLQPRTPLELAERVRATGVDAVQLALDPLRTAEWPVDQTARVLREAGIEIRSGMIAPADEDYTTLETIRRTGGVRPDATWDANLAAARAAARVAGELGIRLISLHAGFIPERTAAHSPQLVVLDSESPELPKLLARIGMIADALDERGLTLALETGMEHAEPLRQFLGSLNRRNVGVNFDPANIILYGVGDPLAALQALASKVKQVHLKDAQPPDAAGAWGAEVPLGQGAVNWTGFVQLVESVLPDCDLMIEREAGAQRVDDIRHARDFINSLFFHHRVRGRRTRRHV